MVDLSLLLWTKEQIASWTVSRHRAWMKAIGAGTKAQMGSSIELGFFCWVGRSCLQNDATVNSLCVRISITKSFCSEGESVHMSFRCYQTQWSRGDTALLSCPKSTYTVGEFAVDCYEA